jgi:hypothetical protein
MPPHWSDGDAEQPTGITILLYAWRSYFLERQSLGDRMAITVLYLVMRR